MDMPSEITIMVSLADLRHAFERSSWGTKKARPSRFSRIETASFKQNPRGLVLTAPNGEHLVDIVHGALSEEVLFSSASLSPVSNWLQRYDGPEDVTYINFSADEIVFQMGMSRMRLERIFPPISLVPKREATDARMVRQNSETVLDSNVEAAEPLKNEADLKRSMVELPASKRPLDKYEINRIAANLWELDRGQQLLKESSSEWWVKAFMTTGLLLMFAEFVVEAHDAPEIGVPIMAIAAGVFFYLRDRALKKKRSEKISDYCAEIKALDEQTPQTLHPEDVIQKYIRNSFFW
ncbi:hypothetical protein [Thalassococcus lentus]|uniref:Uncharacterized protein n=1 Tax=Thalassococcus lentus TaxID=1210524 RepID=A0ABT4XPE0_9RHOB|nr:hypothetical protein [Thalassococcus lentus]MDA7423816.1 hypothetical protein [Thalassococcus lentus]